MPEPGETGWAVYEDSDSEIRQAPILVRDLNEKTQKVRLPPSQGPAQPPSPPVAEYPFLGEGGWSKILCVLRPLCADLDLRLMNGL